MNDGWSRSALVFVGAGIGATLRYWLGGWVTDRFGIEFPLGTFIVNATGCLGIGLAMGWILHSEVSDSWRLGLVVGLLGGYTTFSSFSLEAVRLIEHRQLGSAAAYIGGSCAVGLIATWLGLTAANFAFRS